METPVQLRFRVIRGPDWAYKKQDGGKGHAGTVVRLQDATLPPFPKNTVLVHWDSGDKGLYRAGCDQAYDLRIIETANSVSHLKIWCDGCYADEIKGIRWKCSECFNFDLCTTCYMNNKHDLDHVFMRVLSSHKTSKGPKMLPRSSSLRIALQGSFPGAKVVGHPQCSYKKHRSDKQLGRVMRNGQTLEDKVKGQVAVEFSSTTERIDLTKIVCTLPGFGGYVYEGHLPLLGDLEPVNEGDRVLVTATPEELEKLHKCRGLWDPSLAKKFRKKGLVKGRTNTGDFEVTFCDTKETFIMNSAALRKIHHLCLGQLVRISADMEMVKRLQFGHGGWTAFMKKEIGKVAKVIRIDGLDIHVKTKGNQKYIFNAANLTPTIYHASEPEEKSMAEAFRKFNNIIAESKLGCPYVRDPHCIRKIERMVEKNPELIHCEPVHGMPLISFIVTHGGGVEDLKSVVKKGAFIESHDEDGCTPLLHATVANKPEMVRYLLEQGADVNATSQRGYTSLCMACTRGFSECAHYLLMHGADINEKCKGDITPVRESIASGNQAIVDLIMDRKDADLKTVSSKSSLSTMHVAAAKNNTHAMMKLLDMVPRLVEATVNTGETPLHSAVENGHFATTELLIKKGHCNVNVQEDTFGITPLAEAISGSQFHLVEVLLKNGADPNISNHRGNTSLQVALNVLSSNDLIDEEPYMVEMKKKWGHLGIKTNADALLAFLVSHGGDLNARNCRNVPLRDVLHFGECAVLPALSEIQARAGKDIARQQSTANRPLRNLTKKTDGTESQVNSASSFMKPCLSNTGSKKQKARNYSYPCKLSTGRLRNVSSKRSRNVRQRALGDSSAPESKEQTSDTGELDQLHAELEQKDEERNSLWSKVKTLEHLVKKKISFTCGHDVIRSIADLFPKCPLCREPITSAVDLQ